MLVRVCESSRPRTAVWSRWAALSGGRRRVTRYRATMPNFCAAPNCTRKSTQSDLAFFRFPRDPDRCQKWVENCRRSDLEDKTPDQLNKHYRLCAQHFEDSMICRSSPYRTVLRDNAIPTIFDLTSHLGNPGRQRKRIKELSEEEIKAIKERKRTEMVFGLNHSFDMASKSFLDIELLIALVRLHPVLYDPQNTAHIDPRERKKLWQQISSEIFVDWNDLNPLQRSMKVKEVQTQWQSLCENFRRELHYQMFRERGLPCAETSAFSHFKDLLFLKPLMMPGTGSRIDHPTSSEVHEEDVTTEDDLEIIYIKDEPSPDVMSLHAGETSETVDLIQSDDESQITQDELSRNLLMESQEFQGSHMDFAKSLVPYLAQVPYSCQTSLRVTLTNIIFCYIENARGQAPRASPELLGYISSSFQQPP